MSDLWVVGLAVATAAGAWAAVPVPLPVPVLLGAAAFAARKPLLLCVASGLAAACLSARSHAGLARPGRHQIDGGATLLTDPEGALHHSVRVELRVRGRHVEAFAHGRAATILRPLLAGQTVRVAGAERPVSGVRRSYLATRHISTELSVVAASNPSSGSPVARLTNGVRRVLMDGAASMPAGQRAMYAGFVLGDGRGEPPATVTDFRNSGLTHLLVVSGENVAFVLALAAVPLRLLGLRGRFVGGLLVLLFFGALTRWEPSVVRAEAMAAIALLAAYLGRPASTLRLLALAVSGLLLIDPLLVRSVGFLLSVGACTGIATLAGPITRRLRLPLPMAVTLAAQVGVAPVLLPVFGSLPLASVPANLLAVPAAGPLTMWGMGAGVLAGLAGGTVAAALHVPTRVLMAWIECVAHWCSHMPLPRL